MANRTQGRAQAKNPNVYDLNDPNDRGRYERVLYLDYVRLAKKNGWPLNDDSANAWVAKRLAQMIELSQN
jgi:hypothetical protein